MPKQKPVWCGEHEHSSKIGAAACSRTQQRSATENAPQEAQEPVPFNEEQREQIFAAIDGTLALIDNKHARSYDIQPELNPDPQPPRLRKTAVLLPPVSPRKFDKDAAHAFIIALIELERGLLKRELHEIYKRWPDKKYMGRRERAVIIAFAKRLAHLIENTLGIQPTKGRALKWDKKEFAKFIAKRGGGLFATVVAISLEGVCNNPPQEMFPILNKALGSKPPDNSTPLTGKKIKKIDGLRGMAYEAALAQLTPRQQKQYLQHEYPTRSKKSSSFSQRNRRIHRR